MSTMARIGRERFGRSKLFASLIPPLATGLLVTGLLIATDAVPAAAYPLGPGYLLVGADGGAFTFGQAQFFGSMANVKLNQPVVGGAEDPFLEGYWMVARDGGIFAFGSSGYFGSVPALGIHVTNIEGMSPTPPGLGYWLTGSDGGVFTFGDAPFRGSLPGLGVHVNDIVGIAGTPDGGGYWLTGSDGGVFAFGDAGYHGSLPGLGVRVNDIVGIAPTPDGGGYWLTGSDGGVFAFGDAGYLGSLPGLHVTPNKPVVGISARPPLSVKVDPYAGGGQSSNWVQVSPGSWQLQMTGGSGNPPAGARVLGVEGLNVSQLGTLSFVLVSGTCDGSQPYFLLEARNGTGGIDQGRFACSGSGGQSFTPTSQVPAGDVVTALDIVEPSGTSAISNIGVAGLVVTDFRTFRQGAPPIG